MENKRILVILTGGTICSAPEENSDGKNQSNAKEAKSYLISDFKGSDSPWSEFVEFDARNLIPDILSENMTIDTWNNLLDILREDGTWTKYAGIIILHGTDTLAYTSAMLSMLLAGSSIPVCMVSAQLPLRRIYKKSVNGVEVEINEREDRTNGYANFRAAVELIANGIKPNVYVVYRNVADNNHEPGEFLVHYGAALKQCPNYSNNFHSQGEMKIECASNAMLEGRAFETGEFYLDKVERLENSVMLITPYTGLLYSRINLTGLKAIVHGTYHSETVCVERKEANKTNDNYTDNSILYLLNECKKSGVSLFLAPCDKEAYSYASTGDALRNGAGFVPKTTVEAAYVKTVLGCSLGLEGEVLDRFLKKSINYEFVY